jgi:ribosomal protein S20
METLIIHPENKEQLSTVKAFLRAMKISFKKETIENYNPQFVEMVTKAEKNAEYTTIDPNNLWESLK